MEHLSANSTLTSQKTSFCSRVVIVMLLLRQMPARTTDLGVSGTTCVCSSHMHALQWDRYAADKIHFLSTGGAGEVIKVPPVNLLGSAMLYVGQVLMTNNIILCYAIRNFSWSSLRHISSELSFRDSLFL